MTPSICIHSPEGGRSDFLASVLLDNMVERLHGAIVAPINYKKLHACDGFNRFYNENKNNNTIFVRIDDNFSIENLMQIVFNQFLKNPTTMLDDEEDHFYIRAVEWFDKQKNIINVNNYDHWIDFKMLSDIDYICDLYEIIRQTPISSELKEMALDNIQRQVHWTSNQNLTKLSLLIDYEWKLNLFSKPKSFNVSDFMNSQNIESLLNLRNYYIE
jgi:hypothetical protein